jgi:hypothetical protein
MVDVREGMDGRVGESNGLDSSGSEWRPVAVFYKNSDEYLGCIKGSEFLYQLNDCQLCKNYS